MLETSPAILIITFCLNYGKKWLEGGKIKVANGFFPISNNNNCN